MKSFGLPTATLSGLKHGLTLVIVLMVISSPIVMLVNPALMAAPSSADGSTYAPSTISQGGSDFTAQAALLGPATFRSTDLVSSTAIYEIQFITTTTGVIDKIDVTFPAGTGVALAGIIERVGITGPASITKSGTTVTLDLNTPVSVPAGTFVRLEMVDISNPPNPANYKISVTTKNPSNVPIDGPSLSPAYTIRQVSTGMIANNAVTTPKIADGAVTNSKLAPFAVDTPNLVGESVTNTKLEPQAVTNSKLGAFSVTNDKILDGAITSTKPAESFMKRVTLSDGQNGWNPNGVSTFFTISETGVAGINTFISIQVSTLGFDANYICNIVDYAEPAFTFQIRCSNPPSDGEPLNYLLVNLPLHAP